MNECSQLLYLAECLLYGYLQQVEKVFGSVNPNPAEVEKAKRVLRVRRSS